MSYYVGIDVGDVRIGVAISDKSGRVSFPLSVIKRENGSFGFRKIKKLLQDKEIKCFVVGLPLKINGELGDKGKEYLEYAENLKNFFNIEVTTWDERFTTVIAEKTLTSTNTKFSKKRKVVDKIAAQIILQSYLDYLNNTKTKI